jgi:hypothetical protein
VNVYIKHIIIYAIVLKINYKFKSIILIINEQGERINTKLLGEFKVKIQFIEKEIIQKLSLEEMLAMNPIIVNINERVPGVAGKAIDLFSWYDCWAKAKHLTPLEHPTHLSVEAVDEFCATMAWSELQQAALLYEQEGLPLLKGYPLRLYVPDGSSACLNVKSVVKLDFIHQSDLDSKATYGFKNKITLDELKKK